MSETPATASRWIWPWIIDPRADLLWLIGGAALGYLLLAAVALGIDAMLLWFAWVALIDSPHFFGTYARTYLDPDFRRERPGLLYGSLAWFGAGPAALIVSFVLFRSGSPAYLVPWQVFLGAFVVWAFLHVVRQHYGILALYQRKGGALSGPAARFIEKWLTQAGLAALGIILALGNAEARRVFGLPVGAGRAAWEPAVLALLWAIPVLLALAWLFQLARTLRAGGPLHAPKLLFLAAVLPYFALIAWHPAVAAVPIVALGMFTTVHHDLQYEAIVWFYFKNRRRAGRPARGLAASATRSLFVFLGCGAVMGAAFRLFACSLEINPGCFPLIRTSGHTLFGSITTREALAAVLVGLSLHHYWIDQFIWRPSRDARLAADLRLQASGGGGAAAE